MTSPSLRCAVFFTPAPGSALLRIGEAWLGRDSARNRPLPQPELAGLSTEAVRHATAFPRHYGLHATLKPPFRLAEGVTPDDVSAALQGFAVARPPVAAPPLRVAALGSFLALTPDAASPEIDALAADCVRSFDRFRAPPTEDEIARRRPETLTQRQRSLLGTWGYPYVMEEFRFHITLSGPLDEALRAALRPQLAALFAPATGVSWALDSVALFVQRDEQSPFVLCERYALGAGQA